MTSTSDRSKHWAVTTFDQNDMTSLNSLDRFPHWLKTRYGGKESTLDGKPHLQIHLECKTQQRFAAIKKWLPKSHIEIARAPEASIKYALKPESAIGPKETIENTRVYLSMAQALTIIGRHSGEVDLVSEMRRLDLKNPKDVLKRRYWTAVRDHCSRIPEDISLFSQPQMLAAWVNTHETWVAHGKRSIVLQSAPEPSTTAAAAVGEGEGGGEAVPPAEEEEQWILC